MYLWCASYGVAPQLWAIDGAPVTGTAEARRDFDVLFTAVRGNAFGGSGFYDYYFSSTEMDSDDAWVVDFSTTGNLEVGAATGRLQNFPVRCIKEIGN